MMSMCTRWLLLIGPWSVGADEPPALTTLSQPNVSFEVPDSGYYEIRRGPVRVVIVDNREVDNDVLPGHRAGYSGVAHWSHRDQPRSPFVPAYAGLNFEHIHDGTIQSRDVLFEPRRAAMELRVIDKHTVDLYQAATPHWGLESCTRYHVLEDGAIEMTFECIPRRQTFDHDYVGLFWASYIDSPHSKWIHFRGTSDNEQTVDWIEAETPAHGELSTHLSVGDDREFIHSDEFPLTLVFNRSRHRYVEPWYYGVCRGMGLALLFRPQDKMRLTQSPSGGGQDNPAWDFQHFVESAKVGQRYQMVMRAVYVPFESRRQMQRSTADHRRALGHPVDED